MKEIAAEIVSMSLRKVEICNLYIDSLDDTMQEDMVILRDMLEVIEDCEKHIRFFSKFI